jgi:hypothetical protein
MVFAAEVLLTRFEKDRLTLLGDFLERRMVSSLTVF